MSFWQEMGNKLSDPAVVAVVVAAILGLPFYYRQLVLKRRIKMTDGYNNDLDSINDSINDLVQNYRDALSAIATIGDSFKDLSTNPSQDEINQIRTKVNERFEVLGKLIQATRSAKLMIIKIIDSLSNDPMIAEKFGVVSKSLQKESNTVSGIMDRCNILLIPLNTLPPNMSGGQTVSPELFNAIVAIVNDTINQLIEFQNLTIDTKKLIHNTLVGRAWLFKKYRPVYLDQRKAMTKKGIRDYSVESSRWLRFRTLIKVVWG